MVIFPSGIRLSAGKALPLLLNGGPAMRSRSFGGEMSVSKEFYTAEKFAACLQTCLDIGSLRKLHACILIHGFGNIISLVSKLLNHYAYIGGLSESKCMFRRIVNQDLSLRNSVIVGLFRGKHFNEALWLYSNLLKLQGIGVDSSSITFSLKSCIELGDLEFGRGIHVDAHKVGLNVGKFVGSSLVGLYSICGNIEDAQQAFEDILDKDVVAYTAMITGYAQFSHSCTFKAFNIAKDLLEEGLDVNRVTLVSLLQAAGQMEALKQGRSIHCYALRREISLSDEVLETSLVDMYARCGAATEAASLLKRSEGRTVASWNAMIASLVHNGQNYEVLKLFHLMVQEAKLPPDSITLANMLPACVDLNCAHRVTSIHGYLIRREIPLDLVAATSLIDVYSRCDKIKYARKLFDQLMVRDTILYSVMISGYLQNGKVDEAIKMFNNMVKEGARPNSAIVLSLLSAFADLSDIHKGKWIHGFVVRAGLQSIVNVSNQIMYMYAKCGRVDMARKVFNSILGRDLVSWTSMMMGYIDTGHADEALALFQLMQATSKRADSAALTTALQALIQLGYLKHVKEIHGYVCRIWLANDSDINNSLIISYAKCGRSDTAKDVFDYIVERRLNSWNTMIAAYGMHGSCREALELFDRMQRENIKPDEVTFTSLLSACSHAGLVEEAWQLFCSMDSLYSISPQEEHYGCMVDLLGRSGQLEEAYDFVKCSPLRDRIRALRSLLGACRIHGNTKLGVSIGKQLVDLEPENLHTYALVSNIYAQASNWSESEKLRILGRERGFRKVPGYSLIESSG